MVQRAIALVALLGACEVDPKSAPSPFAESMAAAEVRLAGASNHYDDGNDREFFRPQGIYRQGAVLWVWSKSLTHQIGLVRAGEGWRIEGERRGPARTTACTAWNVTGAVCVGEGGWVTYGATALALPQRGGYRDVWYAEPAGLLYVIDGVSDELWVLDDHGSLVARTPVPPAAYRLGPAQGFLWLLSGINPRLALIELDSKGVPKRQIAVPLAAPARDAAYDASRQALWTVGPVNTRVRRAKGPLVNLETVIYGYPLDSLALGQASPRWSYDLSREQLVDGTHVTLWNHRVVVAAAASHRVWIGAPTPAGWNSERLPADMMPQGMLVHENELFVTDRLADTVLVYASGNPGPPRRTQTLRLGSTRRTSDAALGEALFYGAALWQRQFTCNSCHWDGRTDHRLHPGFLERRWEVTRPLAGVASVVPVFSTGDAPALSDAIEGLFRILDDHFWEVVRVPPWRRPYWLADVPIHLPDGPRWLSPDAARLALLAFLIGLPQPPGPLRNPGQPFSAAARQGFELFARDCLPCHEGSRSMRSRVQPPRALMLAELTHTPLTFGAPLFAETGAGPSFTTNGNRVTPLFDLGRGGPFFTSGRARTLREVLESAKPHARDVHGETSRPHYTEKELRSLFEFLLSI